MLTAYLLSVPLPRFANAGAESMLMTPTKFEKFIEDETEKKSILGGQDQVQMKCVNLRWQSDVMGQFLPIPLTPVTSALPPTPTIDDVGEVQSRPSCT